jgi:hypothetical protein
MNWRSMLNKNCHSMPKLYLNNGWKPTRLARFQVLAGLFMLLAFLLPGCRTPKGAPAPLPAEEPQATAPAALPPDDIPPDVSPAIRAHLLKLQGMSQDGQISQADYDSRRALLLRR